MERRCVDEIDYIDMDCWYMFLRYYHNLFCYISLRNSWKMGMGRRVLHDTDSNSGLSYAHK